MQIISTPSTIAGLDLYLEKVRQSCSHPVGECISEYEPPEPKSPIWTTQTQTELKGQSSRIVLLDNREWQVYVDGNKS
jgi:hypothetical protein